MADQSLTLVFRSPEQTAAAAQRLAVTLERGDVILISGPVGAGKSHFCRSLISAILEEPEDIPSPTFTLVQCYETTRGDLWHSDLYRITSTHEIEELGLTDAFESAISLVEWPDRLGDLAPEQALHLALAHGDTEDSRTLHATWCDTRWSDRAQTLAAS